MFDDLAEQVDEFTSSQLSQIFGTSTTIKPELCGGLSDVSPPKLLPSLIESLPADESIDNRTMLQNVAALFSAADKNVQSFQQEASRKKNTQSRGMSSLTLDWATKRRQRRIGLRYSPFFKSIN
jgi:hypothetical protein